MYISIRGCVGCGGGSLGTGAVPQEEKSEGGGGEEAYGGFHGGFP